MRGDQNMHSTVEYYGGCQVFECKYSFYIYEIRIGNNIAIYFLK